MHLVDDDDLAHESQVAHQHVARLEGCEQHLINRANHNGRQRRAPALPHPAARVQAQVPLIVVHFEGTLATFEELHKALVETVLPMGQLDAKLLRLIAQDTREPCGDALEHRVRRSLSGQRDKHALQPPGAHQQLCGGKGQLGLPGPGRCLNDHEIRVLSRSDLYSLALGTGRPVRGRPPKAVTVEVSDLVGRRFRQAHGRGEGSSLPGALDTSSLLLRSQLGIALNRQLPVPIDRTRTKWKIFLVRGKPVSNDECRGVGGCHCDGQLRQSGPRGD